MSEKKYEVRKPVNIKAETKGLVKDWLLFFGEIIKASVEGVVEFWGKKEEPAEPVVEALPVVDTEELSEEDEEILAVVEEAEEAEAAEEPAEEVVLSRRERRRAKKLAKREARRAAKLARKEEKKAKKEAKKAAKAAKKAAKAGVAVEEKADEQKAADQKKLPKGKKADQKADKPVKKSKRHRYVTKDLVMMKKERAFYDGIKSAVGLRYVVKARVPLNTLVKKSDGKRCKKNEDLGQMDFGVFDLKNRLRVLVEVRGMRRKGRQSKKMYRRARRICRRAGIPVITFWAKYGVIPSYIKTRMKDYMKLL